MSREAIDEGHEAFLAAMVANDADALMEVLTEDVTFYPPHESPARGKPAVRAWYEGVLAEATTMGVEMLSRHVTVSDDLGVEQGEFTWSVTPIGGGEPVTTTGSVIAVWRPEPDGRWRCFADIWNSPE